jgi:hypothetical protein
MNMIENIFMDVKHCPQCGGVLRQKRPYDDIHLIIKKNATVRLWCPCGYYRDEVDIYNSGSKNDKT